MRTSRMVTAVASAAVLAGCGGPSAQQQAARHFADHFGQVVGIELHGTTLHRLEARLATADASYRASPQSQQAANKLGQEAAALFDQSWAHVPIPTQVAGRMDIGIALKMLPQPARPVAHDAMSRCISGHTCPGY